MNRDYFIGLDVGSDSVGWAATDTDFKLLRMKGKTAWGAHIFSEASDAKSRRAFRTSGRRLARRKYRIALLNSLFKDELAKKDDTFLLRLSQSGYHLEDKDENAKFLYPLFKDKETEKAFYKTYPTIWHLRAALLKNDAKALSDIRFVYLAIHHIIKYRGNFLHDGTIDVSKFDMSIFKAVNDTFSAISASITDDEEDEEENNDDSIVFIDDKSDEKILKILQDGHTNKVEKKKALAGLVNTNEKMKDYSNLFIALVVGGSFDLTKIVDDCDPKKISFDSGFDDNEDAFRQTLGDAYSLVEEAKEIYDFVYLYDLLGNEKTLSGALVNVYETHKKDLRALKDLLIETDKAQKLSGHDRNYYKVFGDKDSKENYAAFVHVGNLSKRPSVHDFDSFLSKKMTEIAPFVSDASKATLAALKDKASRDELLIAISNVSNSTIPHQLHETELRIILQNASRVYPSIKENSDKILSLFRFRVPYYYGPLNDRSPYSHVVRKEDVTITPWNIETSIDDDATRKKFMASLTNNCTYLFGETVLPASSILYQDFVNLNRLNGMRINGTRIEQSVKTDLFTNLISKRAKTSVAAIEKYLKSHYESYRKDGVSIAGLNDDDEFASPSRFVLQNAFDINIDIDKAEQIILYKSLYSDCPRDALISIKKAIKLSPVQEKAMVSLSCKGWGRLSRKFLNGIKFVDENGEIHRTIYELLLEKTLTLQEIVNDPAYHFNALIDEFNSKYIEENGLTTTSLADRLIEEASPMDRRPTIQAVKIVKEIAHIAGHDPSAIAIEVTRTNKAKKGDAGKKDSRKRELDVFLASIIKDAEGSFKDQAKASKEELDEIDVLKLKGKHLYLYFKQMGLDMYTAKPIPLAEVLNGTNYDIDHIVPQSKIKDDSLDNMVLVKREINQKIKKDMYPLPREIRFNPDVMALWKYLLKKKGISDTKYNALMRETPITDNELADFVNNQINIVNRSNKLIRDVLRAYFPNTRLIFSKASYPSYIRKEYDIPKVRDLNDAHHAVDAYLNILCGVVLDNTYSRDMRAIKWRESHIQKEAISDNMERTMDRKMNEPGISELVRKTVERHDFLLTYRCNYQDNAFYEQTINPVGKFSAMIPVHSSADSPLSHTEKYGGYKGIIPEYFLPATYGTKKHKILGRVPVLFTKLYRTNETLYPQLTKLWGIEKEPNIRIEGSTRLLSGQKVFVKGCQYLLQSFNEFAVFLKPVTPVFVSQSTCRYLSVLNKKIGDLGGISDDTYSFFTDRDQKNRVVISKQTNLEVYKEILAIANSKKYDYCPMISNLRQASLLDEFQTKSLFEQAALILGTIKLYGRNSATAKLPANYFSKGVGAILGDDVKIIYESVTGLYSVQKSI